MAELKIGFLPLYLQFYKESVPQYAPAAGRFAGRIAAALAERRVKVIAVEPACLESEIAAAVARFELEKVDAVVTLHLAYSPSLEAIGPLGGTELPLIMLDTTPDAAYPPDHSTLMANHGIHGVQDLANVLRRAGKDFRVVAGFHGEPEFYEAALLEIMAAHSAAALRRSRVGLIGRPFSGMGDFLVDREVMRRKLGVTVVDYVPAPVVYAEEAIHEFLRPLFGACEDNEPNRAAAQAALAVRQFLEEHRLTAFSFNFQDLVRAGLPGVPFLAASLAMARKIGYAGEGDALTAAFVGALLASRPATTFSEMFCPDWERNLIYLSHMGEVNFDLLDRVTFAADPNPFIPLPAPVVACGTLKSGRASLVNLAPAPADEFELIVMEGGMIAPVAADEHRVGGYFRPARPLGEALRLYSENGGTHHLAAVYDTPKRFYEALAAVMKWKLTVI